MLINTTINTNVSFGTNGIVFILTVVAKWLIFQKMDEKGWKAIIPLYSDYILYSRVWRAGAFWLLLLTATAGTIVLAVSGAVAGIEALAGVEAITASPASALAISNAFLIGLMIGLVLLVISMIISIKFNSHLSRAFGHGTGFTLGLIFLNPIFLLVLALGKDEYLGPQV